MTYGIGAGDCITVGLENDRFPVPSVVKTCPDDPPVIVMLETEPKSVVPVMVMLPEKEAVVPDMLPKKLLATTVLLAACKAMLPALRPFFTLKYLNATVPYIPVVLCEGSKEPSHYIVFSSDIKF